MRCITFRPDLCNFHTRKKLKSDAKARTEPSTNESTKRSVNINVWGAGHVSNVLHNLKTFNSYNLLTKQK